MKQLSIEWTKGLNPEQKENFERTLRNNTLVLARMQDILAGWEDVYTRQELSDKDFDDGNWAYKQAYRNGARSSLKRMRELISFVKG